ncbi:AT-hook motif nuclear-localized protein 6-like [Senna tora]|uniref:AT-hook motif nuclear-localized protein n=1 Tax=Senna tora TaxID=362788 RepID=A0A834WBR7_9FABA|nr:AT-hook motif nuclear-localized protein 6-like [Senna tora]
MEEKESSFGSGLAVKANEAPGSYHVASTNDNSGQFAAAAPAPVSAAANPTATASATPGTEFKKKRGRPRKYGPDGSMALALSPMPISSSIPLTGDFSGWKRGRGRPTESIKKSYKFDYESPPGPGFGFTVAFAVLEDRREQ